MRKKAAKIVSYSSAAGASVGHAEAVQAQSSLLSEKRAHSRQEGVDELHVGFYVQPMDGSARIIYTDIPKEGTRQLSILSS